MATTSYYMNEASDAMAMLMAGVATQFYVYVEYQNTADANPVTPPTVTDLSKGVDYYITDIAGGTLDFLRIPVTIPVGLASTNAAYDNNQASFYVSTSDGSGYHGNNFTQSGGTYSHVYGSALVLAEDPADPTKDKVLVRSYYDDSILKPASGQVSVVMPFTFNTPALP